MYGSVDQQTGREVAIKVISKVLNGMIPAFNGNSQENSSNLVVLKEVEILKKMVNIYFEDLCTRCLRPEA